MPAAADASTSNLPELVVSDDGKKKKKAAKAKQETYTAPASSSAAAEAAPPPQGVTMGTASPADTGTTTFDANAVGLRSNGAGDANSFLRNLPNVQYQNQGPANAGASPQKTIDTKPAAISISGARTYENNFIVNGVSVNNITGTAEIGSTTTADNAGNSNATIGHGGSAQTIYVPSEFIGQATVIDSNASAEYGQFLGGVVMYDLMAPPTDRYHASVSTSKESSDYASYILGTADGKNTGNYRAPEYEKNKISASVGAPITSDFAFIAQASRLEAESGRQKNVVLRNAMTDEYSDNIFFRFAATARTDNGKFTLDSSHTSYFQRWEQYQAVQGSGILDVDTESSSTKIEHLVNLPTVRNDGIGLNGVRVKTWAYYNESVTKNLSPDNKSLLVPAQRFSAPLAGGGWANEDYNLTSDACPGVTDTTLVPRSGTATSTWIYCKSGGFGNMTTSQTDYGVQSNVDGKILLGSFKAGAELKHYDASRVRPEEQMNSTGTTVIYNDKIYTGGTTVANANGLTKFTCAAGDELCSDTQFANGIQYYRAYAASAQINALHNFAEFDQTLGMFNLRAGARIDYDDYQENINIAPRTALTVKPFDGVSITGGFNQYYLGETLYYAIRAGTPSAVNLSRSYTTSCVAFGQPGYNPDCVVGKVTAFNPTTSPTYQYKFDGLATPYDDEYSGAIAIRDPLLDGQWRLKYLERYGRDQFATVACAGVSNCWTATNGGETSYRSASAEYTKAWNNLDNVFNLNAAALTGNVTWSRRSIAGSTYLVNVDVASDATADTSRIWYNGKSYLPEEFSVVTGNFDIPVRFGATVATLWFDGLLELGASASVNLAYEGIRAGNPTSCSGLACPGADPAAPPPTGSHTYYVDARLHTTLKLDLSAKINVTENAYIEAFADNITNSDQNALATATNPWVLGRTFWVGSGLKF